MKNRASSRSGLFLMELIIAILFFSVAGAFCIQLFVRSHQISQASVELNPAVLWCQNMAEAFDGCEGDPDQMTSLWPEGTCSYTVASDETVLYQRFDADFQPLTQTETGCYLLTACIKKEQALLTCSITVTAKNNADAIYSLSVTIFPKGGTVHEP